MMIGGVTAFAMANEARWYGCDYHARRPRALTNQAPGPGGMDTRIGSLPPWDRAQA
jgi:hypothetical protein